MPRLVLVLPVRPRLLRLLPLDLRLRQVALVGVPLVVVIQIPGAPREEGATGERGQFSLAHPPLESTRVWRTDHDLLQDAAPRSPSRERLRSQAVLGGGGGGGSGGIVVVIGASEGHEGVAGRVATVDRHGLHGVSAHANAVCVRAVDVNRKSSK